MPRRIQDRDDLKQFVMMSLGAPILNIEVTEMQMDIVIDRSVDTFAYYNQEQGAYLHYFNFYLSAGVSEYCLSGMEILDLYSMETGGLTTQVNTLFTPANIMMQQYVSQGRVPFGMGGGMGYGNTYHMNSGLNLTEFEIGMEYLKTYENKFGAMHTLHWRPQAEVMTVVPAPKENLGATIAVYIKENENNMFNNILFQNLAIARAGMQWGDNITKTTGAMPDGLTINGDAILAKYTEREKDAVEEIKGQSQPIDFWMA